mmetsp:Transcript_24950/g.51601  ORF Transcript_24950/g.51601 Transcript_24950/m.51601 type:complete len:317 (-) Transcript_24950:91-1041(-)
MGGDDDTDLAWFKAGSIAALTVISAAGVYGGFRMGDTSAAAALGNCFAGGVLLSTALVHMLSDAVEGLDGWVDFPVATCCFGGGYLLQLCVESLLLDTPTEKAKEADAGNTVGNAASPRLSASLSSRTSIDGAVVASPALTFTSPPDGYRASHGSHGDGEEGHSHDDPLGHMPSAVAVLVALTVHSLLEGLAIGVQSSVDSTFVIAAAVLLHKGFAAFALGAAFSRAPAGKMLFCLVFVFASPIGIGIGWASANEVGGRFTDVLSSVCAGSLLYVAVHEIIDAPIRPDHRMELRAAPKLVAALAGYAAMSALAIWA